MPFITEIFFILSAILLVIAFFGIKKTAVKLNGFLWIIVTIVALMAFNSFAAEILILLGLKATLFTMACIYLLFFFPLAWFMRTKRSIQRYEWPKKDILGYAIIALVTFSCAAFFFTKSLVPSYETSDPARHFLWALEFSRMSVFLIGRMNFHAVNSGIILKLTQPFIHSFNMYKIFILCDVFYFILNAFMFFGVVKTLIRQSRYNWFIIIGSVIYAIGYPLNILVFGFGYFQTGLILIMTIFLMTLYLARKVIQLSWVTWILFLMITGLVNSYLMFVPVVSVLILVMVFSIFKPEKKITFWRSVLFIAVVFLIPFFFGLLFYLIFSENIYGFSVIGKDGYSYKDVYRDFMLLIPLGIAYLIAARHTQQGRILLVWNFWIVLQAFGMLILGTIGIVSPYYYGKNNALIWLILALTVISGLVWLIDSRKWRTIGFSLIGMIILYFQFPALDGWLKTAAPAFHVPQYENRFFPIMSFNLDKIRSVDEGLLNAKTRLYLEARNLSESTGNHSIPIITLYYNDSIWYQTLTGAYPEATESKETPIFAPWEVYEKWLAANSDYLVFIDNKTNYQLVLNELIHNHHLYFSNKAGYIFEK